MKPYLLRLKPSQDIKLELLKYAQERNIKTASIVSAVGSVSSMKVRIADGKTTVGDDQNREVLSLSGTLINGKIHAHIGVISTNMDVFGGHLMEGCVVHTTMEITLLDLSEEIQAERIYDSETGFDELNVIDI
jgi:predicted DNA-binding protein with PD1-like motif